MSRMKRKLVARRHRHGAEDDNKINITSLLDILTVLIFFLLQQYNIEAPYVPNGELHLPFSSIRTPGIDALKVIASRSAIAIHDVRVADISNDQLFEPGTHKPIDGMVIPKLLERLNAEAEAAIKVYKMTPDKKFEGNVILEADATLPYSIIRKVMATAGKSDFVFFKFAVAREN